MATPTESSEANDGASGRSVRSNGRQSIAVGERVAWIAVALGVAGLAFGLVPAIYGSVGESAIQPGEQVDQELSDEQQEREDAQFTNSAVQRVIQLGPYFGLLLSVAAGLAVGVSGRGSETDLVASAAVGAFAGAVLFLVLSSAVAVTQWTTFEDSAGFGAEISLEYGTVIVNGAALGASAAIGAAGTAYAGTRVAE